MNSKKQSGQRVTEWITTICKVICGIIVIILMILLLAISTVESYRWATDIEYRVAHQVVEIGQCEGGDGTHRQCVAIIADGRTVHTTFAMARGMTIYERCFIRSNGSTSCQREFEEYRRGEITEAQAIREYNDGL